MTPEEYAAAQAAISAATANYVLTFGKFLTRPALSVIEWLNLLKLLFPEIARQREASADLARRFYDFQRQLFHPELPVLARLLEPYEYKQFVASMEPARSSLSKEDSPINAVGTLALRAVREVENAGRRQIIGTVESDHSADMIRGWARVATGRETCAWCLMLISRGPTYYSSETAGLNVHESEALASFRDAPDLETFFKDITDDMEQWHDGCDCKVIPVFKRESWFGEDAAKRALDLWNDASNVAKLSRKLGPAIKKSGKDKGRELTLNEEAINVLRQMLASGEIDTSEWAALAAA